MAYRKYEDFVEACVLAMPTEIIPEDFCRWAALTAVSGALSRRVWYDQGAFKVRPNLYVVLVGPPGSGKTLAMQVPIDEVLDRISIPIGADTKDKKNAENTYKQFLQYDWSLPCKVVRGKITYEQLCRSMSTSTEMVDGAGVEPFPDSSVFVRTAEFGVFMKRTSIDLQMLLTEGWDSGKYHEYLTKNSGKDLIKGPTITWLAGATASQFHEHMPANANEQGLLSRIIPVLTTEARESNSRFVKTNGGNPVYDELAKDLAVIHEMRGAFTFSDEAGRAVDMWIQGGELPSVEDPMMAEYKARRFSHLIKLSMCWSAARRSTRSIELQDWESAQEMLFKAEADMPSLFRRFHMTDSGRIADDLVEMVKRRKDGIPHRQLIRAAMRVSRNVGEAEKTIEALISTGTLRKRGNNVISGEDF